MAQSFPEGESFTIGIDPGLNGAVAVLSSTGRLISAQSLVVCRDRSLAWIDGVALGAQLPGAAFVDAVYVERVSAMPRQGVSSCFKFGSVLGSILSVLQYRNLPLHFVTPAQWKGHFKLGKDKQAALHKARLLYPSNAALFALKKDADKAEATLIARYAQEIRLFRSQNTAGTTTRSVYVENS